MLPTKSFRRAGYDVELAFSVQLVYKAVVCLTYDHRAQNSLSQISRVCACIGLVIGELA